jgi:hypothetical protein
MDMEVDFLEKNLEDIIFENKDIIHMRGFPEIKGDLFRQFVNHNGKRLDLFSVDKSDENVRNVSIYELKKGKIDHDAYFQLVGYFFDFCVENKKNNYGNFNLQLYLIGSEVDEHVLISASLSEFVHIYTYKYEYDGIRFYKMSSPWSEMKTKIL